MYDWMISLIGAPSDANTTIVLACTFMCVMLFIVSVNIFLNTLFNFFKPRK